MILVLDTLFVVLLIGLAPVWLILAVLRPNLRASLIARLRSGGLGPPLRGAFWLHGSSAGEIDLLRPLIGRLEKDHPEKPIVISAFAISGYAAARKAYPKHRVIFLPTEFSLVIRRALRRLKPEVFVIVESELWPNLILNLKRAGIPICLMNGKMSAKSLRAYRRFGLMRGAVRALDIVAVQSAEHADRYRSLGARPEAVHVTGNMKYDLTPVEEGAAVRAELRERYAVSAEVPVVIAGSIHSGEDEALAEAASELFAAGRHFRLVVVPRYPAEAQEMAATFARYGLHTVRKSSLDESQRYELRQGAVLIVDTMGELKRFYAMSDIAYVGGSMHFRGSNKGGHNLMEPAIFGVAVLFGPFNLSFRETAHDMLAADAGYLVGNTPELRETLDRLISDPDLATQTGIRAKELVLARQGATSRNYELLRKCLRDQRRKSLERRAGFAHGPAPEDNALLNKTPDTDNL